MHSRPPAPRATTPLILIATLIAFGATSCSSPRALTAADEADVRAALRAYVDAWLSNDAAAVMATLTDDIVLQPHHGVDPVVGAAAVRAWWFPAGPPTVVTSFTLDVSAVQGTGSLAYAWGRSSVAWDYEGKSYANEGNALSVLKKGDDGAWRIAHQIWNDPPNQVQ